MKSNTKYTALEILKTAGFKNPNSKFGKYRIVIGGLQGIVDPSKVLRIPSETKELEVVVGIEARLIEIEQEN